MYSISLIRKIQARFQPSRLDNWISNGKVLNPDYEKTLLKLSFQEFYGQYHALVNEFANIFSEFVVVFFLLELL